MDASVGQNGGRRGGGLVYRRSLTFIRKVPRRGERRRILGRRNYPAKLSFETARRSRASRARSGFTAELQALFVYSAPAVVLPARESIYLPICVRPTRLWL